MTEADRKLICKCEGLCFAKGMVTGKCRILREAYKSNCPFQKVDRHYTKGIFYDDYPEGKDAKL